MALAVTGAQGNVQATVQNTDALAGTILHGEVTIVTTPATANAMFRVSVSGTVIVGGPTGATNSTVLNLVVPGKAQLNGASVPLDGGLSAGSGSSEDGVFYSLASEVFVGPSTAVKAVYTLLNPVAEQSQFIYNISYHYASSVIT